MAHRATFATRSPGNPLRTLRIVRTVLTALFLAVVTAAGVSTWQAWRTRDFRPVPGAILSRGVSSTNQRSTTARKQSRPTQFLHLVYRYEVDGQTYDGNRIQAGTFGMASGDSLKRFGERFPEGQQVPVYVDPDDPGNAVLVPGLSSVATMLYAISGLVGFGVFLLRALTTPPKPGTGLP
jgi:hypothetical protein